MSFRDILKECKEQNWIPILVMRSGDETIVPLFNFASIAHKFAKRNLPKKWFSSGRLGSMQVTPDDEELMKAKGWTLLPMTFPRKMDYEFDIEVWEYSDERVYMGVCT